MCGDEVGEAGLRRTKKRNMNHQVVKMTIQFLLVKYGAGMVNGAAWLILVAGHQVMENSPGGYAYAQHR